MKANAVVLFSGGLDSTTVLALALRESFCVHTLSFDYGQRHRIELERAEEASRRMGADMHKLIKADLRVIGGSALTDSIEVPQNRSDEEISASIPVTYVPARNTLFLSYALAYAEVIEAKDIFVGVNAVDYSGYPDCRPEFIEAFENLANLATRAGVTDAERIRIHAPLIHMSKAEIIRTGMELGVDYSRAHSCYAPSDTGLACGHCDSCILRLKGFSDAGLQDPAPYKENV
ncbi:MAG: 7-cyano-7-deazaguanine synthase QueC [Candidatus Nitrohelix vancouverensis]|uniref:7-cyano-7-deazaguanine synthase n=1 Tax=Candidatus Nitrohelix vancouverensis TaxID=2705534 RepID=A0A7T0G212_9BACT|nr:MAG: 7-cyano-7-deazaguanine synthase QueC [Candidatus Nitrohelix vancouverensis]